MQEPQERLLLDTNVFINLISRTQNNPARSLLLSEYSPFKRKVKTCISDVVFAETKSLMKSAKKSVREDLIERRNHLRMLRIDDDVIEEYSELRYLTRQNNLNIKQNDLWIGAASIVHDCLIITFDVNDFKPLVNVIPKLKIHCLSYEKAKLGNLVIL